jgi:hypothetical protein
VDLGVRTDHVLTFELALPPARYDSAARALVYEEFAQRVDRIPGVRAAGGVSRLPATGEYHMWGTVALTGPLVGTREASVQPTPQQRVVSGDYYAALGIRVIAGRTFDARDDAAAPRRFVVSKSLADRLFPGLSAVGQRLRAGGREGEIIGVVSDVAIDPEGTVQPHVYHAHRQFAGRVWALPQVIAASGAPTVVSDVRRTLAELDPQLVMYRPMPLAEAIGRGTADRVFTMRMLSSFAAVAIALAALGLFGVLSYAVKLRGREFGIRLALGAAGGSIRGMVLRQGLTITALGIGIGLLGALALSRVMTSLVFGVSPLDPFVLAGAALLMTAIAVSAAYLPAYRATAVDPRSVLQGE